MKTLKVPATAVICLFIFTVFTISMQQVSADSVSGSVPYGAGPKDKQPQICVKERSVTISPDALGNDAPTMNVLNLRPGQYAFTGEQIRYDIVVRDPNGALDIGHAFLEVAGFPEVLCNEGPLPDSCDGLRAVDPLLPGPPIVTSQTTTETDKAFHCIYTVQPVPEGDYGFRIKVQRARANSTASLYQETWHLNPVLAIQLRTSDNLPVSFEDGSPGEFVHSKNTILITNDAPVNMWMFIAASDMYDPSGPSKCPVTNKMDVEGSITDPQSGLYYRAHSGTLITSVFNKTIRPGDMPSEGWAHITNPNQNLACTLSTIQQGICGGARPLLSDMFLDPGTGVGHNITNGFAFNMLSFRSTVEVELKLKYPVPCIGRFSQGSIFVFGKPV